MPQPTQTFAAVATCWQGQFMLTWNQRQEELCRAYIQAIAACCGLSSSAPRLDFGIDVILHEIARIQNRLIESGFRLDVQAKSTTLACVEEAAIRYDLEVRTYDVLRMPAPGCPRILVVLVLPPDEADWFGQTEDALVLRHCAYWLSLRGQAATKNRKSVRIRIPRANVFSVSALQFMMARIRRGELL
jgi:hypothetical protein